MPEGTIIRTATSIEKPHMRPTPLRHRCSASQNTIRFVAIAPHATSVTPWKQLQQNHVILFIHDTKCLADTSRSFGTTLKPKTKRTAHPKAYPSISENNFKFNPSGLYIELHLAMTAKLQSLVLTISGCSAQCIHSAQQV